MVFMFYLFAECHVGICGTAMARVSVDVYGPVIVRAMLMSVVCVSIEGNMDGLGLCYHPKPC